MRCARFWNWSKKRTSSSTQTSEFVPCVGLLAPKNIFRLVLFQDIAWIENSKSIIGWTNASNRHCLCRRRRCHSRCIVAGFIPTAAPTTRSRPHRASSLYPLLSFSIYMVRELSHNHRDCGHPSSRPDGAHRPLQTPMLTCATHPSFNPLTFNSVS